MKDEIDFNALRDRPGLLLLHGDNEDGAYVVDGVEWVTPLAAVDRIAALVASGRTVVKFRLAEIVEPDAEPEDYEDVDDEGEDPDFDDDDGELDFE